jgi:hypothetical protein
MRKHASLIAFIRTLTPDSLRALSRIAIHPGIEWSRVRASIALFHEHVPEGIGTNGERLGPVRPTGTASEQPPVIGTFAERFPDVEGRIPTAELSRQIGELDQSGIVGVLNVEHLPCAIPDGAGFRIGEYLVLTTHAGTQSERSTWIRSKEPPIPDNVTAL